MALNATKTSGSSMAAAAGMQVQDGSGGRLGILGALLARNSDDAILGVTAAHILPSDGLLFSAGTPALIGAWHIQIEPDASSDGFHSTGAALALAAVEPQVTISGLGLPSTSSCNVADPILCLGTVVRKVTAAASTIGRVTGVECPIRLRDPQSQQITLFRDALEITWESGQEIFATKGDSGAAVIADNGDLLGIIFGGNSTCCFAAPLKRFLQLNDLRVAEQTAIDVHNRRIARPRTTRHRGGDTALPSGIEHQWPVLADFGKAVNEDSNVFARTKRVA